MGTTDSAVDETLGDRIARLRRARGWKQQDLAERIGMNGSQVSKFERGTYIPRADTVTRVAEALGVSTDYLLTGREPGRARRDYRLRERLEALEGLPETQRSHLVAFLDSLIAAHQWLLRLQEQEKQHALHREGGHGTGKGKTKRD